MVLGGLSKSAGSAYTYAKAAFGRGLSANAALSTFKELGGSVRRTDFLNIYRELRGVTEAAYHVRNIRKDFMPDPDRLPHAITNIRRDYSFNVRLNIRDGESGERFTRNITVTSDRNMTLNDIEAEAESAYYDDPAYGDNEIESYTLVEAKRR